MAFPCYRAILKGLLLLLLPVLPVSAQSIHDLSLHEVLEVALENQRVAGRGGRGGIGTAAAPPYRASSWLAGLPSVSMGYLGSDERDGTDETQVSLNLPVLSPRQRRQERALAGMAGELEAAAAARRALYLSGLIRESAWSHQIETARAEYAGRKVDLLRRLTSRQRELHAAQAISSYALLLVQKERVVAELKQQTHEQEARRWSEQYREITGLSALPASLAEPAVTGDFVPGEHPQLRALELGWLQRQQLLLANSNQSAPWNLALTAKKLETGSFEENQYGLNVDIPLAFLELARQTNNSEWLEASREFDLEADQVTLTLQQRWNALSAQAVTLNSRQQLLDQSSQLSRQIAQQARALQASNELEEEMVLRRLIDAIDSREEAAINLLLISENIAMRRQAMGLPL